MENIFCLVKFLVKHLFSKDSKSRSFSACVLTVQLNELVTNGQLQEFSIIRLDRYLRSDLKGQAAKFESIFVSIRFETKGNLFDLE